MFRTTCSKIHLPPGIYKYARNNGLQSIMSVKTDKGSFEDIEAHYKITAGRGVTKVDSAKRELHNKNEKRDLLPGFLTPLEIFSEELRKKLGPKALKKGDLETMVTKKWAELSYEEKKVYTDQALTKSPMEKIKKKKISDIPLPALKRFASTISPGLKQNSPHLAERENVSLISISPTH